MGGAPNIQFDIFLGYDGVVQEANWFPVVCEIKNDGPAFNGVVQVTGANFATGQPRQLEVELPTGTLKRVVLPVFSTSWGYSAWDVQLLDERGRVRAEQKAAAARKYVASDVMVLGSLPRTPTGAAAVQPIASSQPELQPASARFQASIFPDNPLALEGMVCLYLNSERALDLTVAQVNAIMGWLHAGGNLIIAVEQITDINSRPWLRELFPSELNEMRTVRNGQAVFNWIRSPASELESSPFANLAEDPKFRSAELQVASGRTKKEAQVVVSEGDTPLVTRAPKGLGKVTGLLFSPEREPFRSWQHLPVFWTRLAEVPQRYYATSDFRQAGNWSSDGIFGAMLDTRQVNKLPVHWLLLLLLVYLAVIGPLDQYWLKRIQRPMLTWVTFPCYVVFFSVLIYFIGYRLRAGESEWNELQVVDVLQGNSTTQFRGRTYASVYAPSNQRYELKGAQKIATLRPEFAGSWGGAPSADRGSITQTGDSFAAEVFVPVWASQLLVSDWWQPGSRPIEAGLRAAGNDLELSITNVTGRSLPALHVAFGNRLIALGELPAGKSQSISLGTTDGVPIPDFVTQLSHTFQSAVQSRRQAFGRQNTRIDDIYQNTLAVSFIKQIEEQRNQYSPRFLAPRGLDLTSALQDGTIVIFAWDPGTTPTRPMHQFTPKRQQRNTLWRVVIAP